MAIAKAVMMGRKNGSKPLYAPNGVEITEKVESWVITSREYRVSHPPYTGVRFSKAKWHESDRAMMAFLYNFGTAEQKRGFAASGRECPTSWSVIRQPQEPSIGKFIPNATKHLTQKQKDEIVNIVESVFGESGIDGVSFGEDGDNHYAFMVFVPIDADERFVVYVCNKLFHRLGLLPHDKGLLMGEMEDYCGIVQGGGADGECYIASFNHPIVMEFGEGDLRRKFILKNWRDWDGDEEDRNGRGRQS